MHEVSATISKMSTLFIVNTQTASDQINPPTTSVPTNARRGRDLRIVNTDPSHQSMQGGHGLSTQQPPFVIRGGEVVGEKKRGDASLFFPPSDRIPCTHQSRFLATGFPIPTNGFRRNYI